MVTAQDGEGAIGKTQPNCIVVGGGVPWRRRTDAFGAFEVWEIQVAARQEEVLRAGFRVDWEATGLSCSEMGCGGWAGDVDDKAEGVKVST
jgi:hypothetical protein